MSITIPRVCESCGKEYVRRGRAKRCEECKPPGTPATRGNKTPITVSKSDDIAYTTEFLQSALLTIGMGLAPMSKHDAAVVFNSARVLPPQIAQVMEQDSGMAERLAGVARRGSLLMLTGTVLLTVVLPIMANHTPFVPDKMKMNDEAVDSTITNMFAEMAHMMTKTTATPAPAEPTDNSMPDLDLSFLQSSSDAA